MPLLTWDDAGGNASLACWRSKDGGYISIAQDMNRPHLVYLDVANRGLTRDDALEIAEILLWFGCGGGVAPELP